MIVHNILKLFFICFLYKNCLATVENLALKKPVYMAGSYSSYPASNAVDGDYNTLAHSVDGTNWMVVDLGGFYRVQYVKMYNINGNVGQASRMNKFSVGLLSNYVNGTSPVVNDKCGTYPGDTALGGIYDVYCTQPFVKYRYVVLFSNYPTDKTVNVWEFKIYGDKITSYMDRYMGCYQNFPASNNQGDVTMLYQCLEICKSYLYAGVTNGKDCYCSNDTLGNLVLSDQCTARCFNDDHVCGSAGYFTVYNVSQCSATNTNTIACNKRDCTVNNGQCGTDQCKLNVIGPSNISECVCKRGYNKRFYNDDCRDTNECLNNPNPCNTNTSTCVNTEGSFKCNCNTGYMNTDDKHCIDVDECSKNTHTCNSYNESCFNTIGSFTCLCKDGFQLSNLTHSCEPAVGNPPTTNTSAIIGGVLGTLFGLLIIMAVILVVYCCCFKRKILTRPTKVLKTETPKLTTGQNKKAHASSNSSEVPIEDVESYYKSLSEHKLAAQFKSVPETNNMSCSYAKNSELKKKNRYKNILPFDHNRIKLKVADGQPLSDYINASLIPSYKPSEYNFIAAQGLKQETVNDFWQMICEKRIRVIVMLTLLEERGKAKSVQYWPDADNENEQRFNDITVKFISLDLWPTHEIRKFSVKKNSMELMVTHMWFTSWPDHGVPENIGSVLNFHHHMKSFVAQNGKNMDGSAPHVLVHCSAGVGRTGTFIGIDYLLEQSYDVGKVDVLKCLQYLRSHRNFMIQTKEQYDYLYKALIAYNKLGNRTCYSINDNSFSRFVDREDFTKMSESQFKMIIEKNSKAKKAKKDKHLPGSQFHTCFTNPQAFVACEMNENLTGDVLYDDVLSDGSVIVFLEPENSDNKLKQSLIPKPGKSLKFRNYTVENTLQKNKFNITNDNIQATYSAVTNIRNTAIILKLIKIQNEYENKTDEETVYENSSKHIRELSVYSLASSDQINLLYKLLKDTIRSPNLPPIPLLYKPNSDPNLNEVLVMLSLSEMMNTHEEVDVYQAVYQLQPHNNNNNCYNSSCDIYSYNNDDVMITMDQYILIHQMMKQMILKRLQLNNNNDGEDNDDESLYYKNSKNSRQTILNGLNHKK